MTRSASCWWGQPRGKSKRVDSSKATRPTRELALLANPEKKERKEHALASFVHFTLFLAHPPTQRTSHSFHSAQPGISRHLQPPVLSQLTSSTHTCYVDLQIKIERSGVYILDETEYSALVISYMTSSSFSGKTPAVAIQGSSLKRHTDAALPSSTPRTSLQYSSTVRQRSRSV